MTYNENTFTRTALSSNYGYDDYRILAIEKWYENEISRYNRKLEFQVEVNKYFTNKFFNNFFR